MDAEELDVPPPTTNPRQREEFRPEKRAGPSRPGSSRGTQTTGITRTEQHGRSAVGGVPAASPGLVIAGRYRLDELLADHTDDDAGRDPAGPPASGHGAAPGDLVYSLGAIPVAERVGQLWRAHDEVLARPVAVLLVPTDDSRAARVLGGARVAARLMHPALVRVFDAGEEPGVVFVVTEYLGGGSLENQLRLAPLEPAAAIDLVAEVASGVAAAHAAGLCGLSPAPRSVLFTSTGLPRLSGTLLEALPDPAVPSAAPSAAARADTVALAQLLYAGLTARWPGTRELSALPSAPVAEGRLLSPRQIRGGVPRDVDALVSRAMGDDLVHRGLPDIGSPAAFAAALEPLRTLPTAGHPYGADTAPIPAVDPRARGVPRSRLMPATRGTKVGVAIGAVVLAVVIAGLLHSGPANYLQFSRQPAPSNTTSATSTPSNKAGGSVVPAAVSEFDPYGDHTDPHVSEVPRAYDGNPSTAWHTQTYTSPDLGKLKPGVGLLVDLGTPRKVAQVHLQLIGQGTTVELLAGSGSTPPATDKQGNVVATADDAGPTTTLRPAAPVTARYWIIWLTKLPAGKGGFQGGIDEMSFQS